MFVFVILNNFGNLFYAELFWSVNIHHSFEIVLWDYFVALKQGFQTIAEMLKCIIFGHLHLDAM